MPTTQIITREEYVKKGLLRKDTTDDGELSIYNYTDRCVFENVWDDITINSRGHIYNIKTGECVARPFSRFWNLGERPEEEKLFDWAGGYDVYTKKDGRVGILYRHNGKFKVASRGSFHSVEHLWATEFIQKYSLACLPDAATLVFEMIKPELKIILDYPGVETLIVLAAFNRHTGDEYPREAVEWYANEIGLPIVEKHTHTLEDCLKHQKEAVKSEGFVIRFNSGKRVKVKTEWYRTLAKFLSNLSPIAVWESMEAGKVKDTFTSQVPPELQSLVANYSVRLEAQYESLRKEITIKCSDFLKEIGTEPKQVGLNQHKLSGISKVAIFAWLKKDYINLDKIVMKAIYPKANEFVTLDAPVV